MYPEWFEEPDWLRVYESFDKSNIWTLEPADSLARDSLSRDDQWVIYVEARVENYFRRYQHTSPDTYQESSTSSDLLQMASQMRALRDATIQRNNFNVYRGYMKGPSGPDFILCDESEIWHFDGHLEELVATSAYPVLIEEATAVFLCGTPRPDSINGILNGLTSLIPGSLFPTKLMKFS